MKSTFFHTKLNSDSTEMIPLIIEDKDVGSYSFGTYSKWIKKRAERQERHIPNVSVYVIHLLIEKLNIDIYDKGIDSAISACNGNIGAWFEKYMESEL